MKQDFAAYCLYFVSCSALLRCSSHLPMVCVASSVLPWLLQTGASLCLFENPIKILLKIPSVQKGPHLSQQECIFSFLLSLI